MFSQSKQKLTDQDRTSSSSEVHHDYERQPTATQLAGEIATTHVATTVAPQIDSTEETAEQIGDGRSADEICARPQGEDEESGLTHSKRRNGVSGERRVVVRRLPSVPPFP